MDGLRYDVVDLEGGDNEASAQRPHATRWTNASSSWRHLAAPYSLCLRDKVCTLRDDVDIMSAIPRRVDNNQTRKG